MSHEKSTHKIQSSVRPSMGEFLCSSVRTIRCERGSPSYPHVGWHLWRVTFVVYCYADSSRHYLESYNVIFYETLRSASVLVMAPPAVLYTR